MVQEARATSRSFSIPNGVVVIGGVDRTQTEDALREAMDSRWGVGNWHLVNPKGGSIGSVPIYETVAEVPSTRSRWR